MIGVASRMTEHDEHHQLFHASLRFLLRGSRPICVSYAGCRPRSKWLTGVEDLYNVGRTTTACMMKSNQKASLRPWDVVLCPLVAHWRSSPFSAFRSSDSLCSLLPTHSSERTSSDSWTAKDSQWQYSLSLSLKVQSLSLPCSCTWELNRRPHP